MSLTDRARSWLARSVSLLVFLGFGLGWTLFGDESGSVFLAVLLPFVGASILFDLGQELGEDGVEATDLLWGLVGAALLISGFVFAAEVGWFWLVAGAVLLVLEILVLRLVPEHAEEPEDGSAVRDDEHVIPEHAVDERARRGVPPM